MAPQVVGHPGGPSRIGGRIARGPGFPAHRLPADCLDVLVWRAGMLATVMAWALNAR
jgi:hypothetical protein